MTSRKRLVCLMLGEDRVGKMMDEANGSWEMQHSSTVSQHSEEQKLEGNAPAIPVFSGSRKIDGRRNGIMYNPRLQQQINNAAVMRQTTGNGKRPLSVPKPLGGCNSLDHRAHTCLAADSPKMEQDIFSPILNQFAASHGTSRLARSISMRTLKLKIMAASSVSKPPPLETHPAEFFLVKRQDRYRCGNKIDGSRKVKDVEEPNEILEKLEHGQDNYDGEEELEPMDFIVDKLQSMLHREDLSQLYKPSGDSEDVSRWRSCCNLFQIDPARTSLNDRVSLFGFRVPLHQYQAFAIYWQMLQARHTGGGFLFDDPGLNMRPTYLAYLVVERQLTVLWADVILSRERDDGRHLQITQHRSNDTCPSESPTSSHYTTGWIACPCRSSSLTSKLMPQMGVRLAIVPDDMVSQWKIAWETLVEMRNELGMKLVAAHPENEDPRYIASEEDLRANRNATGKHGHFDNDTPREGQDRWLVLTSEGYYRKFAKAFEYKATVKTCTENGAYEWVDGRNPGIIFGIVMTDEAHRHPQKGRGHPSVFSDLPKHNRPHLWSHSSTTFLFSPKSLEALLWALESQYPRLIDVVESKMTAWEQLTSREPYCRRNFLAVCNSFATLGKVPRDKMDDKWKKTVENMLKKFKIFLKTFMIRRTAETTWFGRPLKYLKPHTHSDVWLKHNDAYTKHRTKFTRGIEKRLERELEGLQKKWDESGAEYKTRFERPTKIPFARQCLIQWKLRLLATFPYLVVLMNRNHEDHLSFGTDEFVQIIRHKEKNSIYQKYLRPIIENSPKATWLLCQIQELLAKEDFSGCEAKMVIVSRFNPVVLILKMMIEKYVAGAANRVGAIHAGQKREQRTAIIEAFTDKLDMDGLRRQKSNFRFLVGTLRYITVGLQLTRAAHIVLMEPDLEFEREMETYGRVHHIGQKNRETYSYRLIDEGCPVERAIVKMQAEKTQFPGKIINDDVGEDDVPAETKDVAMKSRHASIHESAHHSDSTERTLISLPGPLRFRNSVSQKNNLAVEKQAMFDVTAPREPAVEPSELLKPTTYSQHAQEKPIPKATTVTQPALDPVESLKPTVYVSPTRKGAPSTPASIHSWAFSSKLKNRNTLNFTSSEKRSRTAPVIPKRTSSKRAFRQKSAIPAQIEEMEEPGDQIKDREKEAEMQVEVDVPDVQELEREVDFVDFFLQHKGPDHVGRLSIYGLTRQSSELTPSGFKSLSTTGSEERSKGEEKEIKLQVNVPQVDELEWEINFADLFVRHQDVDQVERFSIHGLTRQSSAALPSDFESMSTSGLETDLGYESMPVAVVGEKSSTTGGSGFLGERGLAVTSPEKVNIDVQVSGMDLKRTISSTATRPEDTNVPAQPQLRHKKKQGVPTSPLSQIPEPTPNPTIITHSIANSRSTQPPSLTKEPQPQQPLPPLHPPPNHHPRLYHIRPLHRRPPNVPCARGR